MDTTVDLLDTDSESVRAAALAALRGWAARRARMADNRADLMAAAWWSGARTVAELARSADVSRDTVYDDLRARGIEPTDKTAEPGDRLPPYAPLTAEAVRELAEQADALIRPAMLTDRPAWLAHAAWNLCIALYRIAALLQDAAGTDRGAHAQDLARRLGMALDNAHKAWAELDSREQMAAWSAATTHDLQELEQAVVGIADLTLVEPGTGAPFSVQISHVASGPNRGWTRLRSDHPQLDTRISAADHLAVQTALHTLSGVLNRRLPSDEARSGGLASVDSPERRGD